MHQNNLISWLTVNAVSGLGLRRVWQLLAQMDINEICARLMHEPEALPLSATAKKSLVQVSEKVESALTWQQLSVNNAIICYDDPNYPSLLKHISDPPLVLFVKGELSKLAIPAIAVVGSRSSSKAGLVLAEQFSATLASMGFAICSGMAAGIDGAAHQGAIKAQGITTAILGTGVEEIYPKRHRQLYEKIQQNGALISEYWPNVKPFAGNFPQRNRIISGLSMGTLVVEARRKSGSLITARLAMEQGREVFAIPGSVLSGDYEGCHDLIRNGAALVDDVSNIIDEIKPLYQLHLEGLPKHPHIKSQVDENLQSPSLLASVNFEVTPLDMVIEHSKMTLDTVLEQLVELELQGWIATVPGGYIRLKGN